MKSPRATRRRALGLLGGGFAFSLLSACQPASQPQPTPADNPLIKPKAAPGALLTPVLASSELAVGRNRFALGLIDARNQPIADGRVHLEFFKVDGQRGTAQKRGEADATFRAVELLSKGLWVSQVSFDEVGDWGAQVTLARDDNAPLQARLSFTVREKFSAPGYGDPAPRSASPTAREVGGDLSRICSNNPPCPLHELSITEALEPGDKPLVVLFATPALCTSAICAPELSAVLALRDRGYADRAHFVHVEIYEHPFEQQKPVKAVTEWRLPSEPWVFVVDRAGVVRDRFEGAAPVDELEPVLKALV